MVACHLLFSGGRYPKTIFQQYSLMIAASSGMPTARYALRLATLMMSEFSSSTMPATFLAITLGNPSVVKWETKVRLAWVLGNLWSWEGGYYYFIESDYKWGRQWVEWGVIETYGRLSWSFGSFHGSYASIRWSELLPSISCFDRKLQWSTYQRAPSCFERRPNPTSLHWSFSSSPLLVHSLHSTWAS